MKYERDFFGNIIGPAKTVDTMANLTIHSQSASRFAAAHSRSQCASRYALAHRTMLFPRRHTCAPPPRRHWTGRCSSWPVPLCRYTPRLGGPFLPETLVGAPVYKLVSSGSSGGDGVVNCALTDVRSVTTCKVAPVAAVHAWYHACLVPLRATVTEGPSPCHSRLI